VHILQDFFIFYFLTQIEGLLSILQDLVVLLHGAVVFNAAFLGGDFSQVTMEAEVTNLGALALYGNLGFIRAKRLHRYYLNGVDAYRLKLLFPRPYDANNMFLEGGGGYNMDPYQVHDYSQHDHHHDHKHHDDHDHHDHQHCGGHHHHWNISLL
jgi:hypothetical protein